MKRLQSNAVWSGFFVVVKVLGTLNMAIDTFAVAISGVVNPAFWNTARALLMVLVIDVAMLAFWGLLDYASNSRENRVYKSGAVVLVWMIFVGQMVIGANLHGSVGVIARVTIGGALFFSTYKHITVMWKSIKDGRKNVKRTLPEKMQALRVGIWQTIYPVVAVILGSPIIMIVITFKLLVDVVRDAWNITTEGYVPIVATPEKPAYKPTRIARTKGKIKASDTPEPVRGSDGLWRIECPVCPEHVAKGQSDPPNAKRSYGGHMSGLEHASNEQQIKTKKKELNGNAAHRRQELSLSS